MLLRKIKELASHSALYSLSFVCGSAVSILLLPVYTRYLGKADYGVLEILSYTNDIFRLIMAAGINNALAKFYHGAQDGFSQQRIVSTSTNFVLISALCISLICWYNNNLLAETILGGEEYRQFINVNILVLLCEIMVTISGTYFVVAKKPCIFVSYNLLRLVLGVTTSVYFLVGLELGAMGMLYGQLASNGIVSVLLTFHVYILNKISWDWSLLKKMLRFSSPIMPALLCATLMHNADRFLIRAYGSLEDVGLYSLGYKFPFMLNALLLASFNRIWTGATIYEIDKEPDAPYQYGRITTYFMAMFVFSMFALSVYSENIVQILAAPKFIEAHNVIPLVALGLCFHAFFTFFTIGAYLKSKTWLLNVAYFPAAIFNLSANILLLPLYGFMAAAWVTVFTYAIFAVAAYYSCRKTVKIEYELRRLVLLFVVGCSVFFLSALIEVGNLLVDVSVNTIFVISFPIVLHACRWFSAEEISFAVNKWQAFKLYFVK